MQLTLFAVCFSLLVLRLACIADSQELRPPRFIQEPPHQVDFLNTTGTVIPCVATGNPMPSIKWTKKDGSPVTDVPGLRHVRPDGSLVFSRFRPEDFRPDVHAAFYRCTASNVLGVLGSVEVNVRGVVLQNYQANVYDEYVIRGNTAVFKCHVPSFVGDYLAVTSWLRDDELVIVPNGVQGKKFLALSRGELHIRNVDRSDSLKAYRCQVKNKLTGETKLSHTAGQLIVTDPTGSIPPRVTTSRGDVSVLKGETAELPCAAQGYPLPKYRWFRKERGKLIALGTTQRIIYIDGSLFIQNAMLQDSGKYVCVVNNTIGEERVEIELTVREKLSVWVRPERITLDAGKPATFNCTITGYPIRSVTWMKDMKSLEANNRIKFLTRDILHIGSVIRKDQGIYQCFVQGDGHAAQGMAIISLSEDAPWLRHVFTKHVVQPGDRFSLRCVAVGNPLPTVTWTLDGKHIPEVHRIQYGDFVSTNGEVVSFVNISNSRPEDGGLYRCEARNDAGIIGHEEKVNIIGPPYIRPMGNITVVAGEKLVYVCPFSGHPVPTVTWMKGERELPFNERQRVLSNGTLIISEATRETDEGTYLCKAFNKNGEEARELTVRIIKKPVISPFAFPRNLAEGMRVIVTCSVLTGDPPISVRWFKDDEPLNSRLLKVDESAMGDLGSTLAFNSVGRIHNGNYTCVARNRAGTSNHTATMVVKVPPRWKIEPSDQSAVVGDTVIFDCQAEGYPPPLIRWKMAQDEKAARDFKAITSNFHIQTLENGSLSIKDVVKNDAGHYLCEASNGVGVDLSCVVRLSVHVAVHFKSSFQVLRATKGQSLKVRCEAIGERPINLLWQKDRSPIDTRSHSRYVITERVTDEGILSELSAVSADRQDSALFSCSASNPYGNDETNVQVLVEEPPDAPSDVRIVELTSRLIGLKWNVAYSGNSAITKYIIQWKKAKDNWQPDSRELEVTGTIMAATLQDAKPMTTYHIRVLAENALGRSEPSEAVSVTTEEEVPGTAPLEVATEATGSRSLKVTWKPPPDASDPGRVRGYYIGYKLLDSPEPFVYKTMEVTTDSSPECILTNLQRATKYVIIVQAFNKKGAGPPSMEIIAQTFDKDPPLPPKPRILSSTASSVTLSWTLENDDTHPVHGYYVFSKRELTDWMEKEIKEDVRSYTFTGLPCGTKHQFYIVAYNDVGRSDPSDVISAHTEGGAAVAPDKSSLMSVNSTFVTLFLNAWLTGGCAISFFVIQYKQRGQHEWTLVSNNISPALEKFQLTGLTPATWYNLLMAAHNDAGTTEAEYVFATLTTTGATVTPLISRPDERSLYRSFTVVVPIVCAVVVLLVIFIVVIVICMKRNRSSECSNASQGSDRRAGDMKGDSISMASVGKKIYEAPREPLYYPSPYATTRVSMYSGDSESSSGQNDTLQRSSSRPEHTYDVPFPPKQIQSKERYSAASHDYQLLFSDSSHHLISSGLDPNESEHHTSQLYPSQNPRYEKLYRQSMTSGFWKQQPGKNLHFSLPDRTPPDEETNLEDLEAAVLAFSTPESYEMSETECDRDFRINSRKGRKHSISLSRYSPSRTAEFNLCIN